MFFLGMFNMLNARCFYLLKAHVALLMHDFAYSGFF